MSNSSQQMDENPSAFCPGAFCLIFKLGIDGKILGIEARLEKMNNFLMINP